MKSIYGKLQSWLAGPFTTEVQKLVQNPYIMSLQNAFQTVLPMILIGSLASLINTLRNFWSWVPDLSLINSFSFGLISIFLVFILPYNVMENKGQGQAKLIAGFTGISILIALANPNFTDGNLVINSGYVGTGGMTVSLIVGLLLGWILSVYFKHGLFSKDTSLPQIVVNWFESLIPGFILISIAILLGKNFDVFNVIENIARPLTYIGNSYLGFVLFYFIMALCYCLGLSAWAIYPIFLAVALPGMAANTELINAGKEAINITTNETVFMGWLCIGGMGCTLPLNIMMLRSKSKKINAIGKASIFPSIFNINEPIMYGLPVVWNPIIMVPYLIIAFVVPTITYIVLKIGLVSIPGMSLMMNYIPQPIATFLTNNDYKGIILWLIIFVLVYMIYKPFFRVYELQEIEKEKNEKK